MIDHVLYVLCALLILSTLLMFSALNPVNAILFLISVFFTSSMVFMVAGVDFIGIIILIVYVGAIAVLFLFIVMMLNVRRIERDTTMYLIIGFFIALLLVCQLQYLGFTTNGLYSQLHLHSQFNSFYYVDSFCLDESHRIVSIYKIGTLLFYDFSVVMILAAVLLLVAMVGAICLTNDKRGYFVRQQYDSFNRTTHIYFSNAY